MSEVYDVLIIGGGLAGLSCAYECKKAGLKALVIEARNRLGGRTESIKVDDYWFDLGGQWIGGTHTHLQSLCQELGIQSFPQYDEGKHVLEINGKKTYYSGNISTLNSNPDYKLDGLFDAIDLIDKLASELDPTAPYTHPNTKQWDHLTVQQWADANVKSEDSKTIIKWFCKVCVAADPSEVSFLFFLHFIRTAGSYSLLADIHGGAQQDRIIGGSQQVSEKLGEKLGRSGVILNSPVRAVYQDAKICTVKTDLTTFRGKRVVIAIPPALAGRFDYRPPMPSRRDELSQRMPMGSVIKTIVIYDDPFWRKSGYSAEALSDKGPIAICYDDSSHDFKKTAIVGFIAGSDAKYWATKTQEERKKAVLECYARWWGDKMLTCTHYLEKYWKDEEYSRGCYLAYTGPGVLDSCGDALRKPVDKIHFAGTETATVWVGYMEGAIESGKRAASEVIQANNANIKSKY